MNTPTPETDVIQRLTDKLYNATKLALDLEQERNAALSTVEMQSGQIMQLRDDRDEWKAKAERTCKFRLHNQLGWDFYVTDCGYRFSLTNPTFCPNCGGRIVKDPNKTC